MRHLPFVVVVGSWAVVATTASAQAPSPAADTLRDTVRRAVHWLGQQAVPVDGKADAVLFPAAAGTKAKASSCIYGGSAGVLLFLENAHAVLHDEASGKLADAAANGLRQCRRETAPGKVTWAAGGGGGSGLYTGDAGIGDAFLVRAVLRGDAAAMATAVEVGDALLASGTKEGEELSWGDQNDIIVGAAGTALFLLELGEASKQPRFVEAARAAGRWLCTEAERKPAKADPTRQLATWTYAMGLGGRMHMPNFAHGTAGVSYALARIAEATGDATCAQAAKDGADWLLEHAVVDQDGWRCAANDKGKPNFMGGWCHGPPGTARLFLLLHGQTGEQRYLDAARGGAQWVMNYQERGKTAGKGGAVPYFPPSYCCGVAGVIDFYCDLYRSTKQPEYAAFAQKAGQYLLDVAIADGDGVKWKNGAQVPGGPVAADSAGCNLDLMLGASGEALALLRLLTLDEAQDPVRGLPDRRVTARPQ